MLNNSWSMAKLGRYAYIKARIGWRGLASSEYTREGPYLIAGTHIRKGRVNWHECDHISSYRYNESSEIALQERDIIITKDGTIGRVAIINSLPGLATINGTMMLIRPIPPLVPQYVYHYLSSNHFQRIVAEKVSGSSIPHIFQRDMVDLIIPIPSEIEQNLIAEVLDSLDRTITCAEESVDKLSLIHTGFLYDLLSRGLDRDDNLRDPTTSHEQFRITELGLLPKDWDSVSLGDYVRVRGGKRLPVGHTYADSPTSHRYLRVVDFYNKTLDFDSLEHLQPETFKKLSRYEITAGEVFISIAGSLGFSGVFRPPYQDRTILTENAARLTGIKEFNSEYLAMFINSPFVQRQIEIEKGTGGGVPKLALFRIEKLKIAKPPMAEQNQIVNLVQDQSRQIQTEVAYLNKLKQIKQGLMQDLLSGRVRVMTRQQADILLEAVI